MKNRVLSLAKLLMMANLINWIEIPVINMDRAKKFYETVLQAQISVDEQLAPGIKMGFINTPDMQQTDVGGALVEGDTYTPGTGNTLVYLNANEIGGVDKVLERVQIAGGSVTGPKILISDQIGFCGFFIDPEGNKMAVHSLK